MRVLFYVRRLTVGGCQLNALYLANKMVNDTDCLVWMSDGGELEKLLDQKIIYHKTKVVGIGHPSITGWKKLHQTINKYQIDRILVFDPVLSLEAFALSFVTQVKVVSYIAAQATPQFYFPRSWKTYFVNKDTQNRYERNFGKSSNRILLRKRIDLSVYHPKRLSLSEKREYFGDQVEEDSKIHLLVTRVSHGKEATIRWFSAFAHYYRQQKKDGIFFIAGEGDFFEQLQKELVQKGFDKDVLLMGKKTNIIPYMQGADFVYGMASSIQQAICCNTEGVVLGDKGYACKLTPNNIQLHDDYHFNMHEDESTPFDQLFEMLHQKNNDASWKKKFAQDNYDILKGKKEILSTLKNVKVNGHFFDYLRSLFSYLYFKIRVKFN